MLNSFVLVAFAEMGDKTQLLALMLAARYQKPGDILAGIFVATLLNHALASLLGNWIAANVSVDTLKWILGLTFIACAVWALVPDKEEGYNSKNSWGAFFTTLVVFFVAEMGDKTQIATVALAARFQDVVPVTIGTTLGMMFSNGLAVLCGPWLMRKVPFQYTRYFTAFLFFVFGVGTIVFFKGIQD